MKSKRYALLFGGGYMVMAASWILVSTAVAASASTDVETLQRIELIKGVAFVSATGICVGIGAFILLTRIERAGATLLKQTQAILHNERRINAGLMASSIAHDANNMLFAVLAEIEVLAEHRGAGNDDSVAKMRSSSVRLGALMKRLMLAGRDRVVADRVPLRVAAVVSEEADALRTHPRVERCTLRVVATTEARVTASTILIHQIVSNLIMNGADATGGRGVVEVRVFARGAEVFLEVHDDGPGIPEERRADIFAALTTTKENGTGLGLFSVKACAEILEGSVSVDASPLGGACIRVQLPVTQATASR